MITTTQISETLNIPTHLIHYCIDFNVTHYQVIYFNVDKRKDCIIFVLKTEVEYEKQFNLPTKSGHYEITMPEEEFEEDQVQGGNLSVQDGFAIFSPFSWQLPAIFFHFDQYNRITKVVKGLNRISPIDYDKWEMKSLEKVQNPIPTKPYENDPDSMAEFIRTGVMQMIYSHC